MIWNGIIATINNRPHCIHAAQMWPIATNVARSMAGVSVWAHWWAVLKRLNQSRCRLVDRLMWATGMEPCRIQIIHGNGHFWGGHMPGRCNVPVHEYILQRSPAAAGKCACQCTRRPNAYVRSSSGTAVYPHMPILRRHAARFYEWCMSSAAYGPSAGRFVRFWASGGAKFPKMGDSLPWMPTNRRAKFDATSFIVGGVICNLTNTHYTDKQ